MTVISKAITGVISKAVKGAIGPDGAALKFLVFDTFTDTNGVLIENHTPEIGGPWIRTVPDTGAPTLGAVTIQNNLMAISVADEGAVVDAGVSDADIQVVYTATTGARSGVLMRSVSDGNTLSFRVRPADNAIDLITWTAGTIASTDATAAFTFVNGQDYTLRVRCVANTIVAYIDGNQVLQATVTAHAAGTRHGITSYGSTLTERYNNFNIVNGAINPQLVTYWLETVTYNGVPVTYIGN